MRHRFFSQDIQGIQQISGTRKQKDIIDWGKSFFKQLSEQQKLNFAVQHLNDALKYRSPRIDVEVSPQKFSQFNCIEVLYYFQTSQAWRKLLLILSYIFMFVLVLSAHRPTRIQILIECSILFLYWLDTIIQIIHRFFTSESMITFKSLRLYGKFLVIMILTADQIIAITGEEENVFRPFLVFRAVLPFFFDARTRKYFETIASLYKDILVYIIFYSIVIVAFGITANQFIILPEDEQVDQFTENYGSLGTSIFLFYVMSSYDSYPDNQLPSIKSQPAVYALFILFIFLNFLIFITVPTSFLFQQFKQHHSKVILIDEIKHQHSLILAFLALCDKQMRISQQRLITFLFAVYRNKVRYVGYITQICLRLNSSKRNFIEINEFMQLSKIIQSNSQMIPPSFNDWQPWIRFRQYVNEITGLKTFVKSTRFSLIVVVIIILSIINSIFILSHYYQYFDFFDNVFTVVFCIQILMKIIGLGAIGFFQSSINKIDFSVVVLLVLLQTVTVKAYTRNVDVLVKIIRVYRIPLLGKQFADKKQLVIKNQFYVKAARLFNQLIIIFPIVFRFFPIYIITSYFLGVLGIAIFGSKTSIKVEQSPYSKYDDYSNFRELISSQFINVQILVEAGWSSIVFDHAYRYGHTFLVISYFVTCHICIVFVIASLLRGVIWSVYEAVHQQFDIKASMQINKESQLVKIIEEKKQLMKISDKIDYRVNFPANTIISRRIIEKKIDEYLFKQNIKICMKKLSQHQKNIQFSQETFESDIKINFEQLQYASEQELQNERLMMIQKLLDYQRIQKIQDLRKEDIQSQINQLSDQVSLDSSQSSIQIYYSQILQKYLMKKFYRPQYDATGMAFDQINLFNTQQLDRRFRQEITSMLHIKSLRNKQLLKNLAKQIVQNGLDLSSLDFTKQQLTRPMIFDNKWILRQTFLSNTSQYAIKKFQFQYLSQVYSQHFDQMVDDLALQPLLTLEAKLTYCLRNLLRYKSIKSKQFFTQLAVLQNKVSSGLLKKGSLFKFVYQIDNQTQNWFTIQRSDERNINIHFLKNGIWLYNQQLQQNKIYAAKDLFSIEKNFKDSDVSLGKKLLKMLFESFETIALSSQNRENFFAFEPTERIYDLFVVYKNIQRSSYSLRNKVGISKIMAIILSNQEERSQPINYQLTKMIKNIEKPEKYFTFDQSQQETLQKLKKLQTFEKQQFIVDKGLPFNFIINFMVEIKDILLLKSDNFTLQVERLLQKKRSQLQSLL